MMAGFRRRSVLLALALVGASLMNPTTPAPAVSGTAGDTNCPHGFNQWTWASQFCYYGSVTYQVVATIDRRPAVQLGPNQGSTVKQKVSLFGGAPCTNYLEGGLYYDHPVGAPQQINIGEFIEWRALSTGGTVQRIVLDATSGSQFQMNVYWYQGGTDFGLNFGPFDPAHPDWFVTGVGAGGCFNEAGLFITAGGTDTLWNFMTYPEYFTGLAVYRPSRPPIYNFSIAVQDDPCGRGFPQGACLNGSYYYNGTWWGANET